MPKKPKKPKKGKFFFNECIECAHCGKKNRVKAVRETVAPAVKAERVLNVTVEKETQTSLADAKKG